jgi:hypothetical protein
LLCTWVGIFLGARASDVSVAKLDTAHTVDLTPYGLRFGHGTAFTEVEPMFQTLAGLAIATILMMVFMRKRLLPFVLMGLFLAGGLTLCALPFLGQFAPSAGLLFKCVVWSLSALIGLTLEAKFSARPGVDANIR